LMGLAGGEFDVQAFSEPPVKTITGSWEFLLMEAAHKRDEQGALHTGDSGSGFPTPTLPPPIERHTPVVVPVIEAPPPMAEWLPGARREVASPAGTRPQIDELMVCSLQGEVLHEWQCSNPNGRIGFLEFLSQKARQLAQGLPLGEFDRLEVSGAEARVVAQIQADRALFVRTIQVPADAPSGPAPV